MIVRSNMHQKIAGSYSIMPLSACTERYRLDHYHRYHRQQKRVRKWKTLKEEKWRKTNRELVE